MKPGRSPLKQPPLHNPGDSLLGQRFDLLGEQVLPHFSAAIMLIVLSGYMWAIQLGWMPVHALPITIIAFGWCIFTLWKYKKVIQQVRLINSGLAAEKAVGQFLEQFRAQGYKVLHDIPVKTGETAFNIDHLLIGPNGIFTIETKYRKKPMRGECIVTYDGQKVLINGLAPDRDPIIQALKQAKWVNDYLKSCTALSDVPITPIVVFPGWFADYRQSASAKVKVVNEHFVGACLLDSPHQLAPHDAKLIESRLTEYIQRQTA